MSNQTASAYDLDDFDRMFADEARTRPFLQAIAAAVRPGDVVVEIGTGTGYFAVACVRAGARHVYAIEVNPAVALGPAVAAANGCADRITFIHGYSTRTELPERGDVLLEDLRGALPLLWGRIPSIIDARSRLLRAEARLVTERDVVCAAPCRLPDRVTPLAGPGSTELHGVSRAPVAAAMRSDMHRAAVAPEHLLAAPAPWASLDYATIATPDVEGTCTWTIERDGSFDGFALWFDSTLAGGARIDNAPGRPRTVYGQAFFPLAQSLTVRLGDVVAMDLRAKFIGDAYVYAWDTRHTAADGRVTTYRQSTLSAALPRTTDALRRRSAQHVPYAGPSAALTQRIVALADGARSLAEIATIVETEFPGRFGAAGAALPYVTALLAGLEDEDAALAPRTPPGARA